MMKDIIVLILLQLPAMLCIAGATFLAYHSKEGWGWLIFLAVVLGAVSGYKG